VITVVDDDESFRRATTSFVRSLGYAVLQFASAEAFLKSDGLHDTHCLISDVQMPGVNGIELQDQLSAGPSSAHHFRYCFSRNESTSANTCGRRYLLTWQTVQR
jgi:CheY-like chemotaxis protein